LLLDHLQDHYALYGDYLGVRSARKHIGWYVKALPGGAAFKAHMNLIDDCRQQMIAVADFLDRLNERMDRMPGVIDKNFAIEEEKQMETTT
jgi:tRNA-dihydrouridine synthase B